MAKSSSSREKSLAVSVVVYATSPEQIESVLEPFARCHRVSSISILDNFGDRLLEELCYSEGWNYQKADNIGFGAGHNLAQTGEELNPVSSYIAIINPDLYIDTDAIAKCLDYLDDNPDVAILSPALRNLDGSEQEIIRAHPTLLGMVTRLAARFGLTRARRELSGNNLKVAAVPALHGACFFIQRAFWNRVGGFDERYFMYLEDLDLCRQVNLPQRVVYFGDVTALHAHGASSRKISLLMWVHLKSFVKYFHKWGTK